MSDYPMLISNKLHSFRNFELQIYNISITIKATAFFLKQSFYCLDDIIIICYRLNIEYLEKT